MNCLVEKIGVLSMESRKVKEFCVSKIVSNLSYEGQRGSREKIIFKILRGFKRKRGVSGLSMLEVVLKKISPRVFLKKKKVGGATYRIPLYLQVEKSNRQAIKWLVSLTCGRKSGSFGRRLIREFKAVSRNQGFCLDKKKQLHQQALSNRAFIKYL